MKSNVISVVSSCIVRLTPGAVSGRVLVGRIAVGLAGAAYALVVLLSAMVVAAALGVGLVSSWAEEPLYARESLQFDYSQAHPTADYSFAVPAGHTIYVSLSLFMPDSDYNRDIGIFQLNAELISAQGNVIAKSSHPSMLRFSSWPIRYARTLLMGVPLLLGLVSETQTLTFPALKHTEAAAAAATFPRDIRITLIPRSGTFALPHFYDAHLLLHSRPPLLKELLYHWKLTLCVWTTFYIFLMLLMLLLFFLRPLIFPTIHMAKYQHQREDEDDEEDRHDQVSESLQRWHRSRSKRKAALLHESSNACSSASSITFHRGEGCPSLDEGSGDSESVCCAAEGDDHI